MNTFFSDTFTGGRSKSASECFNEYFNECSSVHYAWVIIHSNFSYFTGTYAFQGVRNANFSENFAYN